MMTIVAQDHDPFPPRVPARIAIACGVALFVIGSVLWLAAFTDHAAPVAQLLNPLACIGHALFAVVAIGLAGEWKQWRVCADDLRRAGGNGPGTWAGAEWERCRQMMQAGRPLDPGEWRTNVERVCDSWSRDLSGRWIVYLCLAVGPFVLGMVVSLMSLPGSAEPMPAASRIFLPWSIGSVETLGIGLTVLSLRRGWHRLLHEWVEGLRYEAGQTLHQRQKDLEDREQKLKMREQELATQRMAPPGEEPGGSVPSSNGNVPTKAAVAPPPLPNQPIPTESLGGSGLDE